MTWEVAHWADRLRSGDRRALAKAVTLIESTLPGHRDVADALLTEIAGDTGNSFRIGLSGVPGVGKSSFIERFGTLVTEHNHKLAVLAVDPSSKRGGGSILGDKTRMELLSRNPNAFIRPSPAGNTLGGVARRTREAILLCEAAGFDLVLVETVGVGQSETAVAGMTDMFILMLLPAGGDELQGLKKGIVEIADLLLVNKADGDLAAQARRTVAEYHGALRLLRHADRQWQPEVIGCSAITGDGVANAWDRMLAFQSLSQSSTDWENRRAEQRALWFWDDVSDGLSRAARGLPELENLRTKVQRGDIPPSAAARAFVKMLMENTD